MNCDWPNSLPMRGRAAATFLPPATVEETAWDILLALYLEPRFTLGLGKLGALISAPQAVIGNWLAGLEERKLITGARDPLTGEVWAILTPAGSQLLDKYLSATSDLQVVAHH